MMLCHVITTFSEWLLVPGGSTPQLILCDPSLVSAELQTVSQEDNNSRS